MLFFMCIAINLCDLFIQFFGLTINERIKKQMAERAAPDHIKRVPSFTS